MTRDDILAKLRELKPWLESQGVARVRLFGSYARDEARPDSDVDLLVDFSKPMGLEVFSLERELAVRLGLPVDMMREDALPRDIRYTALQDAIDA